MSEFLGLLLGIVAFAALWIVSTRKSNFSLVDRDGSRELKRLSIIFLYRSQFALSESTI